MYIYVRLFENDSSILVVIADFIVFLINTILLNITFILLVLMKRMCNEKQLHTDQ